MRVYLKTHPLSSRTFRAAHAHSASKWRPGPAKSSEICFDFDKFAKVGLNFLALGLHHALGKSLRCPLSKADGRGGLVW